MCYVSNEAGLNAYERRDPDNSGQFSYKRETIPLAPEYEAELRDEAAAWTFFYGQLGPSTRTLRFTGSWPPSRKRRAADGCEF